MVACTRLGWRTRYLGRVGDDAAGDFLVRSLESEGVDVEYVERVRVSATRRAIVLVDEGSGDRTILWHRDPALRYTRGAVPAKGARDARILLVDATDAPAAELA